MDGAKRKQRFRLLQAKHTTTNNTNSSIPGRLYSSSGTGLRISVPLSLFAGKRSKTCSNAPWGGRMFHSMVEANGAMYLLGGANGRAEKLNDAWVSTDGR